MRRRLAVVAAVLLLLVGDCYFKQQDPRDRSDAGTLLENGRGIRLVVDAQNANPVLRLILPGRPISDRTIEIIFPEHVTVRKRGESEVQHLFLYRAGARGDQPAWHRTGQTLEYAMNLPGKIHMLATAVLEEDGVRFRYRFKNDSDVPYDMIYAVTDPRLTGIFHDPRLERTFVHHPAGFQLLASETPERLTMPLNQWLPSRYLASFTWAVPRQRVERRDDGVTYYTKSQAVDSPFIATLSSDRRWVIASFTRDTGNVWTNPELTCQHVDPQRPLEPGSTQTVEVKLLVLQASLEEAFRRASSQRDLMK